MALVVPNAGEDVIRQWQINNDEDELILVMLVASDD